MKKIAYKIKGYTARFNPATGQIEQREILVGVETEYTEANVELAKSEAYNGEYTVVE